MHNGDPSKVKLDLQLSFLKPFFCEWMANAHTKMASKQAVIQKGWDESGMGKAMTLADEANGFCRTSPEFLEASRTQP